MADQEQFRNAMAHFPSGVTIVTATDARGRDFGLTLTAFCSISTSPPLVMISLDAASNTLPAVRECGGFTVNILCRGSEDLAQLFASKSERKFEGLPVARDYVGGPILHPHSCAYMVCMTSQEILVADHVLFIGQVHSAAVLPERSPLLYGRRQFSAWADPVESLV